MPPRIALIGLAMSLTGCSPIPPAAPGICPAYPAMTRPAKAELAERCLDPAGDWQPACQELGRWFADIAVLRRQLESCD